jgi:hypothetical protein
LTPRRSSVTVSYHNILDQSFDALRRHYPAIALIAGFAAVGIYQFVVLAYADVLVGGWVTDMHRLLLASVVFGLCGIGATSRGLSGAAHAEEANNGV